MFNNKLSYVSYILCFIVMIISGFYAFSFDLSVDVSFIGSSLLFSLYLLVFSIMLLENEI